MLNTAGRGLDSGLQANVGEVGRKRKVQGNQVWERANPPPPQEQERHTQRCGDRLHMLTPPATSQGTVPGSGGGKMESKKGLGTLGGTVKATERAAHAVQSHTGFAARPWRAEA